MNTTLMNPHVNTEYEVELEQLKQVAEMTAFPRTVPASPDLVTPSNDYRPHPRYHFAKRLCWSVDNLDWRAVPFPASVPICA